MAMTYGNNENNTNRVATATAIKIQNNQHDNATISQPGNQPTSQPANQPTNWWNFKQNPVARYLADIIVVNSGDITCNTAKVFFFFFFFLLFLLFIAVFVVIVNKLMAYTSVNQLIEDKLKNIKNKNKIKSNRICFLPLSG